MKADRALRRPWRISVMVVAAALAGCVAQPAPRVAAQSPPPDTTVYFYPAQGQSAERQDRDHYECNDWAVQQSGFDPSLPDAPPHLRIRVDAGPPAR
jgi:hypothetical protein